MDSDLAPRWRLALAAALLIGAGWIARGADEAWVWACAVAALIGGATLAWRAARAHTTPAAPLEAPLPSSPDTARTDRLDTWLEFAPVALFTLDTPNADGAPHPLNTAARRLLAPGRIVDRDGFGQQLVALAADRRTVLAIDTEHGTERALANAVDLTLDGRPQRLVAVSPVENELEAEAMQAWQKLVHVLTHEIMNSLTPVASLAGIARKHLDGETSAGARSAREALDFLSQRAQGLARFVEAYRSLARLPDPEPRPIDLGTLLHDVVRVFEQSPAARNITIEMHLPPDIPRLDLDEALLAQALINVLTNAAEACGTAEGPHRIGLSVVRNYGEVEIRIGDTGSGIADDLRDKIFHAFVTTKATGTGTGLNLARQIALAHGGDLVLLEKSHPWNTVFGFVFRISAKDA